MGDEKKARINVYLPLSLMEQVRASAKANYRGISPEIAWILDHYFNQNKKTPAPDA